MTAEIFNIIFQGSNFSYFFQQKEKGKVVRVIDEAEYLRSGGRNAVLSDSKKEKELRGNLKSEVCRLLHKDEVVVLDALNYIKVGHGCR